MSDGLGNEDEESLQRRNDEGTHIQVNQKREDWGEEFCYRFYMGTLPHLDYANIRDWAASAFYDNVKFHCIYTLDDRNEIHGGGAKMLSWILLGFIRQERLKFNYNPLGGIKSTLNNHGILTVNVSGTVHRDNAFIGLFDHTYSLARHPDDGNFKITDADLIIQKNSMNQFNKC